MIPLLLLQDHPHCLLPVLTSYCLYPAGYVSTDHYHNVYHLVFMLEGQCDLQKNTRAETLREGDFIYIDPGERHLFTCGMRPARNFVFNFYLLPWQYWPDALTYLHGDQPAMDRIENNALRTPLCDLLGLPGDGFRITDRAPALQTAVLGLIQSFWREVSHLVTETDPGARAESAPYYLRRCIFFFERVIEYALPSRFGAGGIDRLRLPPAVDRALSLIERDVESRFSLSALSSEVGCTPNYLCTAFSRSVGKSPAHYANVQRIRRGAELLRQTGRSVTDIALSLGFSSPQHFCRNFKLQMGCPPLIYRRNVSGI